MFDVGNRTTKIGKSVYISTRNQSRLAVLEGDYAELCGLGLPLSLSVQLQCLNLSLSGALWSAKASASGFSVSLYWPTADTTRKVAEKAKKTRKKRKRKCKQAPGSVSNNETTSPSVPVPVAQSNSSQLPNNEHPSPDNIDALDTNPSDSPGLVHHSGVAQCSVISLSPTVSDDSPTGSLDCDSPAVDLAVCSNIEYAMKDGVHGVSYTQGRS